MKKLFLLITLIALGAGCSSFGEKKVPLTVLSQSYQDILTNNLGNRNNLKDLYKVGMANKENKARMLMILPNVRSVTSNMLSNLNGLEAEILKHDSKDKTAKILLTKTQRLKKIVTKRLATIKRIQTKWNNSLK